MSTMALGWSLKETKEGQGIDIITRDTGEGSPTKKGEIKSDGTIVIEKIENSAGDTPEGGVPAGSVMAFVGSTAPTGWFVADGSCKTTSTYPQLEAAVTSGGWDQTGCAVGEFKLPNLTGQFLRGSGGSGPSLGVAQADATAVNGLDNATSTVSWASANASTNGATASWASANASTNTKLSGYKSATNISIQNLGGGAAFFALGGGDVDLGHSHTVNKNQWNTNQNAHSHSLNKNQWNSDQTAHDHTITGDTETRPANIGVNYIIKY